MAIFEKPQEIDAPENMSSAQYKELHQCFQQKGELCRTNCVVCCLHLACLYHVEGYNIDQRYLEKIMVAKYMLATLGNPKLTEDILNKIKRHLRCNKFTSLLKECKIIKETFENSTALWPKLMKEDKMMMLGKRENDGTGHLICVLKETEDNLIVFDLQKIQLDTWTIEHFTKYITGENIEMTLYIIQYNILEEAIKKFKSDKYECWKNWEQKEGTETPLEIMERLCSGFMINHSKK